MMKRWLVAPVLFALLSTAAFAQTTQTTPSGRTPQPPAATTQKAPSTGTTAPSAHGTERSGSASQGNLLDINTASKEELGTLPGVGPARADAIIKNRPYRAKNELDDKKIIPHATYEGIKDKIVARQGSASTGSSEPKAKGTGPATGSSGPAGSTAGAKKQ